jgi:type I restriction enzyme M protein
MVVPDDQAPRLDVTIDLHLPGMLDLRQRRDALFEIHTILRSADSLRPDEAFDELVKLYAIWLHVGPVSHHVARQHDSSLRLSSAAFQRATELLGPLLVEGRSDVGADLFQELADVGVRAGLGQYFTPAPVARAVATYLAPRAGESWIDPFCGSGLLLGEIAAAADGPVKLYGIDRDPRVLRLARLEAEIHHPDSPLTSIHGNALWPLQKLTASLNAPPEGFDGVVTNPPFGADVHRDDQQGYDRFRLVVNCSTPLEILGLERSIEVLRPGGRLGIVLPQSIASNRGLVRVREFLLDTCRVDAVLSLPPATFGPFRGVGKAVVVFATKRPASPDRAPTLFAVATDVGWDGTGRRTGEEDVTHKALELARREVRPGIARAEDRLELARNLSPEWHLRPRAIGSALDDLSLAIFTGRTPGRAAYVKGETDSKASYRMLKVGDLTGHGIDWSPGERSHASFPRPITTKLLIEGDIALTAAAHHPRYIGAKVDIVDIIPERYGNRVMPCAEVLVIRPDPSQVDPFKLLLWLRSDEGRKSLQACVTGQTAHLYPDDVAQIVVPQSVLEADHSYATQLLAKSLRLRRESEVAAASARAAFAGDSASSG